MKGKRHRQRASARAAVGALALLVAVTGRAAGPPIVSTPGLKTQMLGELGPQTVLLVERPLYRTFGNTHWYANFPVPVPPIFRVATRLCRLDLAAGTREVVLESEDGWIRDPAVHYDGKTILRILFCSSRVKRQVPCGGTEVAILHRCNPDGSDVRCLSANVENENTPTVLADGRVLFMRWEYVDRPEVTFHHLWTMYPDGTAVATYFGNQFVGGVYLDGRPVPGTGEVVYPGAATRCRCPATGSSSPRRMRCG
jgi:hypothetical protein